MSSPQASPAEPVTENDLSPCPVCMKKTLADHCARPAGCTWMKCRNDDCRATLDLRKLIGFKPDPANRAKYVPIRLGA